MSNEHIARRQSIGIGKEVTSGTSVNASAWIPKQASSFQPSFEKAIDDSAYGVIDEVFDSQTVMNKTQITLNGIVRDDWFGNLLLAALGKVTLCQCITIAGAGGGTPAKGDAISSAAGSWTATIKKVIDIGATLYYFVEELTGTIDAQTDVTDGVWTAGTSVVIAGVNGHMFERLNTNSHPSFTFYGSDPVTEEKSVYCMMEQLELEVLIKDFAKFSSSWVGKKLETSGAQTPAFASDNPFLAKHGAAKFADTEALLNAAVATSIQRFKFTIVKNVVDIMDFGDEDVASFHNQQFGVAGDLEAVFRDVVLRDYVANSTKKACRVSLINNEVTALAGSGATAVYPSMYVDFSKLSFDEWSRSEENNSIVAQTMGFSAEFKVADAMTMEVLLINSNATGY